MQPAHGSCSPARVRGAHAAVLALAVIACRGAVPPGAHPAAAIERHDLRVVSDPRVGIAIAFREVVAPGHDDQVAVLLVHGIGAAGIAAFDPPVAGYSLAEDLARAGHPAYAIDVRGWGRSTRPAALDAPPDASPPAVSSEDAVRDIDAVAAWIRARRHRAIALVGWASGGHWAGMYAAAHPDAVSHLVVLNTLYGTPGPWPMRARLEDPGAPGQLAPLGAYALRDAASLLRPWDANIPVADKPSWRDPRIADAYVSLTIASDPTARERTPPSARVPNGPLRDSYVLAGGTPLWHAGDIRAATLVLRSELDFWSRPEDVTALQRELTHARRIEVTTLPRATHLVFLDRPDHGRALLVETLLRFLAAP